MERKFLRVTIAIGRLLPFMAPRKPKQRQTVSPPLSESVDELTQQVLVLRNAIDDLREELAWGFRNNRVPGLSAPVLKAMAHNPAASDWSNHLQLERGVPAIVEQRAAVAESTLTSQLRRLLLSLCECPELSAAKLDDRTSVVLAEARQVLELSEQPSKPSELTESTPPRNNKRGRLF